MNLLPFRRSVPKNRWNRPAWIAGMALLVLTSCNPERVGDRGDQMALAPRYMSRDSTVAITTTPPVPTVQPGKIYAYQNYLFQVDQYQGIHVIRNDNPATARKIAFLRIPMSTEIAIRAGFLYTNNLNDLVVFDLTNPTSPRLVKRIADAFPVIDQTHPGERGYFECPDPAKGVVVGWERRVVKNPRCSR